MDKPSYQPPRGRLTSTVVIFLFVLMALYSLFLVFQERAANKNLSDVEASLISIEAQMTDLRASQIKEVSVAEELKTQVKDSGMVWSKAMKKFQDLMPVSVFFSNYSADENGRINVSGLGDDFGAVADMIDALERSTDFDGVFVPSVTQGNTAEGQDVVSFTLYVNSAQE